MLIVNVDVHVKPGQEDAFIEATRENARHSLQEPGIARFDVARHNDAPNRFLLVEVYRTADDPARHKETAHYAKWRDTVADMMAQPRSSTKYTRLFPEDTDG